MRGWRGAPAPQEGVGHPISRPPDISRRYVLFSSSCPLLHSPIFFSLLACINVYTFSIPDIPKYLTNSNVQIVGDSAPLRRCTGDLGVGSSCSFCTWECADDGARARAKRQKHEVEHFYSFICLGCGLTHVDWENLRRLHGDAGVEFKACSDNHRVICIQRWGWELFVSWLARSGRDVSSERFTQNQYGFVVMR